MIGVIHKEMIFQFDDVASIAEQLSEFVQRKQCGTDGFLILDGQHRLIGTVNRNDFAMIPKTMKENERYYLFVPERFAGVETFPTEKGSEVNTNKGGTLYTFMYISGKELQYIDIFGF